MKRYKITTRETLWTYYEISVPDDCTDPVQFFYDMDEDDQMAAMVDTEGGEWEVDDHEEIKS